MNLNARVYLCWIVGLFLVVTSVRLEGAPNADTPTPARGPTLKRRAPCFNPRARTGRDNGNTRDRGTTAVSIHAPARGATIAHPMQSLLPHVSIHARTGRDSYAPGAMSEVLVSIHAPARGATQSQPSINGKPSVSIHAPARGATAAMRATMRVGKLTVNL